jgi:hypothetical protein
VRVARLFLWLAFLVLYVTVAGAYVFDSIDVSSKARAMGGAWAATAYDATAIFYNPACLAETPSRDVYASYFKPNSQDFAGLTFLALSLPVRSSSSLAVSYRDFSVEYQGQDLLGESTVSLAYAACLMKDIHTALYMGAGANLYRLDFGSTATMDLGQETTVGFDLGLLGVMRERTRVGLLLKNVNEPSMGKVNREPLPQWITAGISYQPYYGVITEFDIRSLRGEDVEFHMGMEFAVTEFLGMRFGFQTEPNSLSGGLTVGIEPVQVDYSYSSHAVLPGTHHVAIGAKF